MNSGSIIQIVCVYKCICVCVLIKVYDQIKQINGKNNLFKHNAIFHNAPIRLQNIKSTSL